MLKTCEFFLGNVMSLFQSGQKVNGYTFEECLRLDSFTEVWIVSKNENHDILMVVRDDRFFSVEFITSGENNLIFPVECLFRDVGFPKMLFIIKHKEKFTVAIQHCSTYEGKCVVVLLGPSGHGKSTVGNLLLDCLKNETRHFYETSSSYAGTTKPELIQSGNAIILDNPGWIGTVGLDQERVNDVAILSGVKELGGFNMLVLVLNSQSPVIDSSIPHLLESMSKTFGKECLRHLCVVYTNCIHLMLTKNGDAEFKQRTENICRIINTYEDVDITELRFYALECHAEYGANVFSAEDLNRVKEETQTQLTNMLQDIQIIPRYKIKITPNNN